MEESVVPSGETGSSSSHTSGSSSSQGAVPPMPGVDTSDPWYKYAKQMFPPNTPITPEIIAELKKNMMSMISTTISEINARHQIANQYNKDVAQGNE
jgi:hypothetical protein